jgi:hypothetical protein
MIIPAPAVIVYMTIGGSLTAEQVTKQVEQQLVGAVADSIRVPETHVQLLSVANARRRLLALALSFRILALDEGDANSLLMKLEKADIQVWTMY